MATKLTAARLRMLRAIDACSSPDMPADSWGEVYTHYDDVPAGHRAAPLAMRNFDRVGAACERDGLIVVERPLFGISLTIAGRAALAEHDAKVKP